ncbi:MAG TPA: hypothetical protein VGN02_08040, partial [Paenibacillus sp.]
MSVPNVEGMAKGDSLTTFTVPLQGRVSTSFRDIVVHRSMISLLLFALFSEWLYPLQKLIGDDHYRVITLFMVLTGTLLLIGCLGLSIRLLLGIYPLLIYVALYYLYGGESGKSWFFSYVQLLGADFTEIVQSGRLYGVSIETRALLLLIGWTLLVCSVQILAFGRQNTTLFFFASIIYLLALEMTGEQEVYVGLVRTLCWGFILQLFLFRRRLRVLAGDQRFQETMSLRQSWRQSKQRLVIQEKRSLAGQPHARGFERIWLAVCAVILLAGLLGTARLTLSIPMKPVRNIAWDDVIRAWENWSGERLGERQAQTYKMSGYGQDDSKLGASLSLRHEKYFTAFSPYRTYWRGESKNIYTGQGWSVSGSDRLVLDHNGDTHALSTDSLVRETEESGNTFEQTVIFASPESRNIPLFAGGLPAGLAHLYINENLDEKASGGSIYDASSDAVFSDLE